MRSLLITLLSLVSIIGTSQDKLVKRIALPDARFAGIDPAGELYVLAGSILMKFDKDGNKLQELTLPLAEEITSLDTWHLTEVVIYIRNKQLVEIYSPQLELRNSFQLDSAYAIDPQWIAASFDQKHIWIFDKADGSIKNLNIKTGEIEIDAVLTGNDFKKEPVVSMREYQHFLFLETPHQLLVINGMGKIIKTLKKGEAQFTDFFGEELVQLEVNTLHFLNLFSAEKRSVSITGFHRKIFLTDDRMYSIFPDKVDIYAFEQK